jgi:uncharacterized protein YjbI with pentapeptide repeats
MAKSKSARPPGGPLPAPRLAGKTLAFAGRWSSYRLEELTQLIESEGGKVVPEVTAQFDYLVVGKARGRTATEKQADRLNQKQGASIQFLDEQSLAQLFALSRDEALALLSGSEEGVARWNKMHEVFWSPNARTDLNGIDFRGATIRWAHLASVTFDGADFRNADLTCTQFGQLNRVNFDSACLVRANVSHADHCTFRKADLTDAHLNPAVFTASDFSRARLHKASGSCTQAVGCVFRGADFSEAHLCESDFQQADFSAADLRQADLVRCNFSGANLGKAKLAKADLTDAKLVNADLTRANLRDAILVGADLTGATIDGANFTGAILSGAILTTRDAAKAIGLDVAACQATGKIGPNIQELERVARQSRRLETSAVIDLKDGQQVQMGLDYRSKWPRYIDTILNKPGMGYRSHSQSVSAAMIDLARKWITGTLRLDSVTVKSSKCPLSTKDLRRLAVAAWCEACGKPVPSDSEFDDLWKSRTDLRRARLTEQKAVREEMLAQLRDGDAGIDCWNALSPEERKKAGHFRRVDLSGADLKGAELWDLDFQGAVFDGASLFEAKLGRSDLRKASFKNARLTAARCGGATFSGADFTNALLIDAHLCVCMFSSANFQGAVLRGADFDHADLRGADLSNTDPSQARFEHTKYDERTRLPKGFTPPPGMLWKGHGPAPGTTLPAPAPAAAIDFDALMARLPQVVDAGRLANALRMLKADRFQLYAEVKDDALLGVVKSQTDPDLVYSCRLTSAGGFSCCTQNLRPCGGLQGRLCKHLLVLLVGLTKAGRLDPATADTWAQASRGHKPSLDKDAMSETFLRYKGAEAGEIDWRPTETIPEDYYSL